MELVLASPVCVVGACMKGEVMYLGTGLLIDTADELRGRVSGLQQIGFRLAQPLGGFIAAMLISSLGVTVVFQSFGILLVLVSGSLFLGLKQTKVKS